MPGDVRHLQVVSDAVRVMYPMIFWRRKPADVQPSDPLTQLRRLVQNQVGADPISVELITAVAGLLGCVAFADRHFSEPEQRHVREVLSRVQGMDEVGVDAICDALRQHVVRLATTNPQGYTRALREHGSLAMRREVLEALVDLAAADDDLSFEETQLLRRITDALGLTQDDYNLAQAKHRERLSLLK
jgi:uncharacterized tellurite resistance protein B-like protein